MKTLYKILILILCVSCNKGKKKLPQHYQKFDFPETLINNIDKTPIGVIEESKYFKLIDVSNKEQVTLKGSKVIDSCWYVPLETKEECLIGNIDKIVIEDDKIFILDKSNSKDLFIFSLKGTFITRLSKKGRGPGEYNFIRDFTIDSENKHLIIHDDSMAKLFYYDFQGNHIKTKKTSFRFFNFHHFNNSIYYFLGASDNKHSIELERYQIALEKNNELQSLYIPRLKNDLSFGLGDQFHYSGKHLSFTIPVIDTNIYSVIDDKISIAYKINFGDKAINAFIIKKLPEFQDPIKASKDLNFIYFIGVHFETKTKLYFNYFEGGTFKDVIYNKTTDNFMVSKKFNSDDPHSLFFLNHKYAVYEDDVFISVCEPMLFTVIKKFQKKYRFKSNSIKELAATIKETDNLILVFYKYKEF